MNTPVNLTAAIVSVEAPVAPHIRAWIASDEKRHKLLAAMVEAQAAIAVWDEYQTNWTTSAAIPANARLDRAMAQLHATIDPFHTAARALTEAKHNREIAA